MTAEHRLIFALLLLGSLCIGCGSGGAPKTTTDSVSPPLFKQLPASETGVQFANNLSESPTPHRTELLYEYFSNGAGVAVGDVNGDGRPDLYFTGNMRYNALYLNEGNMRFRAVTAAAGVRGRKNTWNTGVTMADVNGDGRLDLYVCYSGDLPLDRRVDELYINQGPDENGVPRFEERAAAYGLAQPHSSNQAYFFDYDRDGDLDLYLQTHNVETLPRGNSRSARQRLAETDSVNGNRFYENRNGTFEDVTGAVGIRSPPLTYGLGAVVSDVNKDGWPDIYVGNDYAAPDYLYLNREGERFENVIRSRMGHTSQASMGVDAADVNNDALADVFVLDMIAEDNRRQKLLHVPNNRTAFERNVASGFHHQYTLNTLQLNTGTGPYSEISQLAGVSNTDWSWASLLADYDNDGWKDLFVTNGILHDITNRDFIRYRRQYMEKRNYDLKPKDVAVLMKNLPSESLENYAFRNEGGLRFEDVSSAWGLDAAANSNGAAYGDLDRDGDLDLVTNNINETAFVYENRANRRNGSHYLKVRLQGQGQNTYGIGAKVTAYTDSVTQYLEQFPTRGYLSSVRPVLHFGLGARSQVDSVRVVWPDGRTQTRRDVAVNQTLTFRQENAVGAPPPSPSDSPLFRKTAPAVAAEHRMEGDIDDFRRQPLLVHPKSFDGPALATADVNGDGRTDVFVGGGNGQASRLYLRRGGGTFAEQTPPAFADDRASNDVDAVFVDHDGDGDPDLYVASGGYGGFSENDPALQDRLYINDGAGTFTAAAPDALPRMRTSSGTVAATDVNGDDRPDLFVGGRVIPGRYPEAPRSYVLINQGAGGFADRTTEVAPGLQNIGMVTDAVWHDLNGTGAEELVVAGEWMPIAVFGNDGGVLRRRTDEYFDPSPRGFWYSVEILRLGDRIGLLAGNLGTNTQLRASPDQPAELFYDDFDGNGRPDPILSYYIDGTRYPHPLLDRLRATVPPLGARFSSYEAYANASLRDLLTASERQAAGRWAVDRLKTTLFRMGEDGRFRRRALPVQAQYAPVYAAQPLDYNDDGRRDLLLAGNMTETRVRFARYDANHGVLLRGNGQGGFEYVPQRRSGFALRGDVRAIAPVGDRLLFGVNRDSIVAYRPADAAPTAAPAVRARRQTDR
ncbi:MAG: VCBS repeat-containing protein [Salinibacter sp.]